jgi:hypothetical protein
VSIQLRCEDARSRSTFAVEFPEFVHMASCGKLATVLHGHSPVPTSMLQHLDTFIASEFMQVDPAVSTPGSTSSFAAAQAAAGVSSKLGIGLMPMAALATMRESNSSGDWDVANTRNALGSSIFSVVPQDLLSLLADPSLANSIETDEGVEIDIPAHHMAMEELMGRPPVAPGVPQAGSSMKMDDFFGSAHTPVKKAAPAAAGPGYDPFG